MGERGPAGRPPDLQVLHGERKSRINTEAPKFKPEIPDCPGGMPAEAKAVWQEVVDTLAPLGMISTVDAPSLEIYCMNVHWFRRAARDLVRRGQTVKGYRGRRVKNPNWQVARDSAEKIRTYARELGLTPAARGGMKLPGPSEEELGSILNPAR